MNESLIDLMNRIQAQQGLLKNVQQRVPYHCPITHQFNQLIRIQAKCQII